MPDETLYTIRLNAQRIEYVLNVIAQRPYAEAAPLIDELRAQLSTQATAAPASSEPARLNGAHAASG